MVYGIGEITYEELSPELQARIASGSGGTVAGLMVIDGVFTKKVVATAEEQTEFEIPFDDYDSLNSHLDIKINSTWINPERYEIVGNKIVLNDGVEIGTSVFFTLFSLADPTGDGGFIEDVEMAETPQEVIVYDGGIIDEKVGEAVTGHNASGEAHADIREGLATHTHKYNTITGLPNLDSKLDTLKPVVSESLNQLLPFGIYRFMNATDGFPSGYTTDNDFILYNNKIGSAENWSPQILLDIRSVGKIYKRVIQSGAYGEWKEIATTDNVFGVKNPNYTGNIDELYTAGQYILQNPFTGTMPSGQNTSSVQWSILNVYGNSFGTGMIYQDLITTNHTAYGAYANKYYKRIRFGNTWSDWKELSTTSKINTLSLLNGWLLATGEFAIYKSGNTCNLNMEIRGGTIASNTILFTLPSGYRPLSQVVVYAPVRNFSTGAIIDGRNCLISMDTNGNVRLSTTSLPQTNDAIGLNLTWGVA